MENQCSSPYGHTKRENRETVSRNPEKLLNKIQHPSLIKAPSKVGIEENFLNLKRGIWGKSAADTVLGGEGLRPLLPATAQRCLLSPPPLGTVPGVQLGSRQGKDKQAKGFRKGRNKTVHSHELLLRESGTFYRKPQKLLSEFHKAEDT